MREEKGEKVRIERERDKRKGEGGEEKREKKERGGGEEISREGEE